MCSPSEHVGTSLRFHHEFWHTIASTHIALEVDFAGSIDATVTWLTSAVLEGQIAVIAFRESARRCKAKTSVEAAVSWLCLADTGSGTALCTRANIEDVVIRGLVGGTTDDIFVSWRAGEGRKVVLD